MQFISILSWFSLSLGIKERKRKIASLVLVLTKVFNMLHWVNAVCCLICQTGV